MTAEEKKRIKREINSATTTIFAYIKEFTSSDLKSVKIFVDDELNNRHIKTGMK